MPYPITKHPRGLFHTQSGLNQIKSDLVVLLLTNPGERVMLPEFGTPLRTLLFEPNDTIVADEARNMIINSIKLWEPRVVIESIDVTSGDSIDRRSLSPLDTSEDLGNMLHIKIRFFDPENIKEVQALELQVDLAGN